MIIAKPSIAALAFLFVALLSIRPVQAEGQALGPGYDIFVVGPAQSNGSCTGIGPYVDPFQTDAIDSRIAQLTPPWTATGVVRSVATVVAGQKSLCSTSWDWSPSRIGVGYIEPLVEAYVNGGHLGPGRKALIVNGACGGVSILSWLPFGYWNDPAISCTWRGLFLSLASRVRWALSQPGANRIVLLFASIGETDQIFSLSNRMGMSATRYQAHLTTVISAFRGLFPGKYPLILTKLGTPAWGGAATQEMESAIASVCAADPLCAVMETAGMQPNQFFNPANPDVAHTAAQWKVLGGVQAYQLASKLTNEFTQ